MSARPLSILLLNQSWLAPELKALGHNVLSIGCNTEGCDISIHEVGFDAGKLFELFPANFNPDRIIYHDNSGTPWIIGLENLGIPSVFYSVDTHHHHGWHGYFGSLFDCVLVAQRDYMQWIQPFISDVRWFPVWCTQVIEPAKERDIDVCFRGNLNPALHPGRLEFFRGFQQLVEADVGQGPYAEPYSRSKIVINETVLADLNFRVFEGMMAGALMLTPKIENGLLELFKDGEHILTYDRGDFSDAAEKAKALLADEERRNRIATAGRELVFSQHSSQARARHLEQILLELSTSPKPRKCLAAARSYLTTTALLRKVGQQQMASFLIASYQCLLESAKAREVIDSDFVSTVFLCKHCLEELGELDKAEELVKTAQANFPHDIILALMTTELLLSKGRNDEAYSLARSISQVPEQLIATASDLMIDIRKRVSLELLRWESQ